MEIITGVERRRRWRLEEKLRIVAETEQPGSGIAEIARRYEISRGLLWNWRSQVRRGVLGPEPPAVFLPVRTISEPAGGNGTDRPSSPWPSSRQGSRAGARSLDWLTCRPVGKRLLDRIITGML